MVIRTTQYIEKLGSWRMDIEAKIKTLDKGNRFYTVLHWTSLIEIGVLSVLLVGINSYFLADPDISNAAKLALNIVVLVLQVKLAIANGINNVITPGKKADNLNMCAKFYAQLARELEVNIEQSRHDEEEDGFELDYLNELTNLFMREQLIHQLEPGLVWIGHKNTVIVKSMANIGIPMSADEVDWITKLINRHHGRKRDRLVEIFNRVLNNSEQEQ